MAESLNSSEETRADKVESLRVGRSEKQWPVFEHYDIKGDFTSVETGEPMEIPSWEQIEASGEPRWYYPLANPRLPFELAKIIPYDKESALVFLQSWGHLGIDAMQGQSPDTVHEPILLVWQHASSIKQILNLQQAIYDGSERNFLESLAIPVSNGIGTLHWMNKVQFRQLGIDYNDDPRLVAKNLISLIVTSNIDGVRTELFASDSGFSIGYWWNNLIEIIYWHLANIVAGGNIVIPCEGCGSFFEQTNKKQKYCPPPIEQFLEVEQGKRSRVQSLCSGRTRTKKHRNG